MDGHDGREPCEKTQTAVSGRAEKIPGPLELYLHDPLEVLGRHGLHEAIPDEAGPVNDPVYATVSLGHLVQRLSHTVRIGHVAAVV